MTKNPSPPTLRLIGSVTTALLLLLHVLAVVVGKTNAAPGVCTASFDLDFIRTHRVDSSSWTSAFAVVPPTTRAPRPRTPCRQTLFPWPAWEGPVGSRSGTEGRGRRAVIRSSAGADADGENEPVSTAAVDDPSQAESSSSDGQLSDEDISLVDEVVKSAAEIGDEDEDGGGDDKRLERAVLRYLPKMRPELVLALRGAASAEAGTDIGTVDESADLTTKLAALGRAMAAVLDDRLASARDLLAELLRAGEIRKLDGAIGRAARDGRLDSAFFTVLNANMDDAFREEQESESSSAEENGKEEESVAVESRLQILRHVYTRCQEEIEKAVSPGAGLLNKLLRTEQAPIRANQLRHYLGRQDSVTTPDGTKVPLKGGKALVSPSELIAALSNAVGQIRQVEGAGGTDRVTAANLVESCRQVAIEARLAIGELYGTTSDELIEFERDLQPVFRPGSGSVDHRTETDSDSDFDSLDDKE